MVETESRRVSARGAGTAAVKRAALWQLACASAALITVPFVLNQYWTYLATIWLAYVIAVLGLRVLYGVTGLLSLAQATFVGLGAYTAALASEHLLLTAPYELLLVCAVSGAFALLIGLPALRVGGLRLALVTLAFGELFQWWLRQQSSVTGGEQGLFVPKLALYGLDTSNATVLYFTVLVVTALCTIASVRLTRGRAGRAMSAVRESETAAAAVGVRIARTKLLAFAFAGVMGGIAGWLIAHVENSASPLSFDMFASIYILVAVILGGAKSTWGAWLGGAYVSFVPAIFTSIGQDRLYLILSGVLLIAVMMVLPDGLASLPSRIRGRLRRGSRAA